MDRILDLISRWDHVGQGFFFLVLSGAVLSFVYKVLQLPVLYKHGWQPVVKGKEDSENDL